MLVCISSASSFIMLNGASEGFFKGSRGLRQGGPFPPFLFILVTKALRILISKAEEVGLLEG